MFLKSREIAFLGIMMAFAVLLVTAGGYIESSTLFFLAAASFLCGLMERSFSLRVSICFFIGSLLLGFLLAPQKLYLATFAGFSIYVLVAEYFEKQVFVENQEKHFVFEWLMKAVVYHVLLILAFFFVRELFGWESFGKNRFVAFCMEKSNVLFWGLCFIIAESFWLLFDRAYLFFMRRYSRYFLRFL